MNDSRSRRGFLKSCVAAAGMVTIQPELLAQGNQEAKLYEKSLLVNGRGEAITSASIEKDNCYVFHYPFVSTPCFLINIGRQVKSGTPIEGADSMNYIWPGGVGPNQSIVAFSAICSHKMSYPTKTISFINYRRDPVHYRDKQSQLQSGAGLIYCCSERSAYDPANGGEVLGGPAPQPLTTIILEYDREQDHYFAIGTLGAEMYSDFFEKFGFRLAMDLKVNDVTALTANRTEVSHHDEFSAQRIQC